MRRKSDNGMGVLLKGLSPAARAKLIHLIACPWCSGEAVNDMVERYGVGLLRHRKKPRAGAKKSALTRFDERSWSGWLAEAEAGKMEEKEVAWLALRAAREVQGSDLYRSIAILTGVHEQRSRLNDLPEAADLYLEAMALGMNAARLLERREIPVELTEEDLRALNGSDGVLGRYRRTFGLLLWERGKLAHAQYELDLAAMEFGSSGDFAEEGATLALIGLLHLDLGESAIAIVLLLAGLTGMVAGERPELEMRALLGLALALCRSGRPGPGQAFLEHAESRHGTSMEEDPVLLRERGRILAALHETAAAVPLLTRARDSRVEQGKLGEAALATFDLSHALAFEGNLEQARLELEALRAGFRGKKASRIVTSLEEWWQESEGAALDARYLEKGMLLLSELRRKSCPGLEPLPFV
jgi:hypothetical protein